MKQMGILLGLAMVLAAQGVAAAERRAESPSAVATVSAEEFAEMKADMQTLMDRFEALAAENAQLRQQQQGTAEQVVAIRGGQEAASWAERIKISGDFRYRYQNDDVAATVDNGGEGATRNRQRIRARPAIIAQLPSRVEVGFGLATGSDDPVSTNQTLGGGGSSKPINLDLAYMDWTAVDGLHLVAGKFKNALVRAGDNGLLWDSDWRPEGLQVVYDNGGLLFGTALGTWLESDSSKDSEFAYGLQGGVRLDVLGAKLKAGLGYYQVDVAGRECVFDDGDCFGNTVNLDGTYAYDFHEIEGFAELGFEVLGLPANVFANLVRNTEADEFDTGYAVGFSLGKAKKRGSWEVGYLYQDLEADAVLGVVTDSDFAGGGTDSKGHKIGATYATTDATNIQLTYFMTERQDSQGTLNNGVAFDVDTLQLDFNFKVK